MGGCCGKRKDSRRVSPDKKKLSETSRSRPIPVPNRRALLPPRPPHQMEKGSADNPSRESLLGRRAFEERMSEYGSNQLLVLRFFKSSDSAAIDPFHRGLEDDHPDVVFLSADVTDNPQAVEEYDIGSTPTFLVFVNGRVVGRTEGAEQGRVGELIEECSQKMGETAKMGKMLPRVSSTPQ